MIEVPAVAWMWRPEISANILFARLKCVANNYDFVPSNPRVVFYSKPHQAKNIPKTAKKVWIPVENYGPNLKQADYSFTFFYPEDVDNNPRHYRLPNYARIGAGPDLIKPPQYNPENILSKKTKFCAFVYSNPEPNRMRFFELLSRYKRVDAPGAVCNNMAPLGGATRQNLRHHLRRRLYRKFDEVVDFYRQYKFVIAFENERDNRYTSEKLYLAMLAGCIPIYWGNTQVHRDFNPKSFINFDGSFAALVDKVEAVDKDPNKYLAKLRQPWLPNNKYTDWVDPEKIRKQFDKILL